MSDTSTIHVRVVPPPSHVGELSREKAFDNLQKRIKELGGSIGEIANELRDQLDVSLDQGQESRWGLDQVQLSFSLDLEAEAGVVVAKAKTSAGFEVQLTWSRRAPATS